MMPTMSHERQLHVPADQAPTPCPVCGEPARLFTPNARRDPGNEASPYEPAWQCTRCGALEFIAPPEHADPQTRE